MKKLFFCLVAVMALLATLQVSAGSKKNMVEERRQTASFERIRLQGSPTIKYTQGKSCTVRVKAPADVIKRVETRVQGGRLVVSVKSDANKMFRYRLTGEDDITVYVTSPDLIEVEVQGSGDFECKSHLDTDRLDVRLKGSGDIEFSDIICDRLMTSLVGSGDIEISHVEALQTSVELVGSGDVKIKQKGVRQTAMELKGSGDIKLTCDHCGTVDSKLLGSGDITLTGTVRQHHQSAKGSGDIHTKGLTILK